MLIKNENELLILKITVIYTRIFLFFRIKTIIINLLLLNYKDKNNIQRL
jgi:hypothetical protein